MTSNMPTQWHLIGVLPNVDIVQPIEGRRLALVAPNDQRVVDLQRRYQAAETFLNRFEDAHGVKHRPTVLLGNRKNKGYTSQEIAGFRDLVALSVIPYNRALQMVPPRGSRILFSDSFSIYPWSLDEKYEYLISSTLAQTALHLVEEFTGQLSPELPHMRIDGSGPDTPLLEQLLQNWDRRFLDSKPTWKSTALFRSLNMANQAARMPGMSDATLYDVGRAIVLWVSAFEILVHPGKGRSSLKCVIKALEENKWVLPKSAHRRYKVPPMEDRVTHASWLYYNLYRVRNDFVHGNPISLRTLRLKKSGVSLYLYASPLYRVLLTSCLELYWKEDSPNLSEDEGKLRAYYLREAKFKMYQAAIENGLLNAKQEDE